MSFIDADLFGLNDTPAYPSAYHYYRSPSLENARTFMEAVGLYVPYEATRREERLVAHSAAAAYSQNRRAPGACGGGKRPRTSASPPPPVTPSDAFTLFQRVDFLHDIHVKEFIHPIIANRLLSVGVQIPNALRHRLHEHCMSCSATVYTKQATATLDNTFGFSASLIHVAGIKLDAPIQRQQIIADAYMRNTVTAWLTPNHEGIVEIVFDGLLESPLEKPAKTGIHTEAHLRSLATCAFLQWMIGEWPVPYGFLNAVREIRFLTGTFQTLDVAGHDAFLNRWVGSLRRDPSSALKSVPSIKVVRISVNTVPSGTSDAALASGNDAALIVHGRRVPFIAERTSPSSQSSELPVGSEAELLRAFLESAPARQVTYAKIELFKMFQYYTSLTATQRADPRVETAVVQAIAVNSFRDAFKADVALARGAVYLTVDKLALVYYELRRRVLSAANRGFALTTFKSRDDDGTLEFKTYRASTPKR